MFKRDPATRHTSVIWKNYTPGPDVSCMDYHGTPVLQWDSLDRMYKVRLAEFTFKCTKGYNVTELKDLFVQRNSNCESRRNREIVLPSPEANFLRNSIQYRGAIAWHSLCSKDSAVNILNHFKRRLSKFDTRKLINFAPIAAVIKHKDDDYVYF